MAAVDLSWLPAGTHDVILGKTLSNALKARNGEPIPGSIVGKEFYTSLCEPIAQHMALKLLRCSTD
jgi:hypothetical protein